jgi:predicted metal-dependent phosphotriesterase family hydrolase
LVQAANALGIDRIVITHPLNDLTMPPAIQREVVSLGALLEFPIGMAAPIGTIPFDEFAAQIRAVGPDNVVLSTDLGQAANPVPAVGFAAGVTRLLEAGFTERELDFMIRRNPARILKIEP